MDHAFGSKWLIDQLTRLGYSVSSTEVYRFKQSIMLEEQSQPSAGESFPKRFTLWVADNVDHNVTSWDGCGFFHGMGIIAVSAKTDHSEAD